MNGFSDYKKYAVALLFCAVLVASLGAQESAEPLLWGSNYGTVNVIPSIAVAGELEEAGDGISIGLYPAAELILYKPRFGDFAFFDFGLEGGGRLGIPIRESNLTVGAYLGGTFHFGLKGLDIPGSDILDRLDLFSRIALGADIIASESPDFGPAIASGLNFFLNDNLKVGLAYSDWLDYSGVSLNIGWRMGPRPAMKGRSGVWEEGARAATAIEANVYLVQLHSLMLFTFYAGGYVQAPESYLPGTGTLWSFTDDEGTFFVERLLISTEPGEGSWWRLAFYSDDEDEMIYEFHLDEGYALTTLYYRDSTGVSRRYVYDNEETDLRTEPEGAEDFDAILALSEKARREDIATPAGIFPDCLVFSDFDGSGTYTWWFTTDESVPGRLVQYRIEDEEGIMTARLEKILSGQAGQFLLKK